jgi:hypothetical protein
MHTLPPLCVCLSYGWQRFIFCRLFAPFEGEKLAQGKNKYFKYIHRV